MIEIKMPSGAKELRISHFKSMASIPENGFTTMQEKIIFLADFLNIRYNDVLDFTKSDVDKMANLALKAMSKMELNSTLPLEITKQGRVFTLVDPKKIGIGWHIDFEKCDINKDPVRLACMFYVPKGFNYSDVDQNGNTTHNIKSRYDLFEKEFELDLFIRASNSFLKRSLISTKRSMVLEIAKLKTIERIGFLVRNLNPLSGKRLSKR